MESLAPFVPPHLLRSLVQRGAPARLPHVDRFGAGLLFSDIAGFTALTERLQRRGRDGAEEIVRIVNAAFAPAIRSIERLGGSVVTFGGDALFSVFDGPGGAGRACAAAEELRAQFQARPTLETSVGPLQLGLSQAVHHGTALGFHLGRPGRRTYVVAGPSVSALARMEARAGAGEVLVSRAAAAAREEPGAPPGPLPAEAPDMTAGYVAPHVRSAPRPFAGEFRRVTIMFLETRGAATAVLQTFVLGLQQILERTGGILVSPDLCATGVRWLCAFGAPSTHEDDPDRAARAALDLLGLRCSGLALRGGIHAGTAAFIQVGIASRASLELMGDVTNTAARTATQAEWGEILVTRATRELLAGVATEPRGERTVKGKTATLELHALRSAAPSGKPVRIATRMVGRDEELSRIVAALERARDGKGTAIGVRGEAGIGKSRLKLEASRAARELGFEVHQGVAVSFGGGAYAAIASLMRALLGLPELAPRDEVLRRVGSVASELRISPFDRQSLAEMLGAQAPSAPTDRGNDGRLNHRLAVSALVEPMARARPRLLVLEDMHWADAASAEVARWLADGAAGQPMVLLLLYRPGFTVPAGVREVVLSDLSESSVGELLRAHAGPVAPAVERIVRERAGGNPFYVEELCRHLRDAGILGEHEGRGSLRELAASDLPETIEALIAARLDRLTADGKEVAQHAAVIGRTFFTDLLARLADVAERTTEGIAELSGRELVFLKAVEPRIEYIFKHALTRDVAYASILGTRRQRLHREVADAIEQAFGALGFEAMLGYHRDRAGQVDGARRAYLAGARIAAGNYAHEEAERLYERYLQLVDAPSEESIAARNELGRDVLAPAGRADDAVAAHRLAIAEAERSQLPRSECDARTLLSRLLARGGQVDDAKAELRAALHLARASGYRQGEGAALGGIAKISYQEKEPGARRELEEALAIHRETGDLTNASRRLCEIGIIAMTEGRLDEAAERFESALAIDRAQSDRAGEAIVLCDLAILRGKQARNTEARTLYEQAIAINRAIGNRTAEGTILGNLASLNMSAGRIDDAQALFEQAIVLHRAVRDRRSEGVDLGHLATLHYERGRLQEARRLWSEALDIHRALGNRSDTSYVMGCLGLLAMDAQPDEARRLFEEAVALAHAAGSPGMESMHLGHLGILDKQVGRLDDARRRLEESVRLAHVAGWARLEAAFLANLGSVLLITGGPDARTRELVAGAEALFRGAGDDLYLGKTLCLRAQLLLASGESAASLVSEARRIAERLAVGAESDLATTLAKLSRAQASFDAGEALILGEHPDDVEPGTLRWLVEHRPDVVPPSLRVRGVE